MMRTVQWISFSFHGESALLIISLCMGNCKWQLEGSLDNAKVVPGVSA